MRVTQVPCVLASTWSEAAQNQLMVVQQTGARNSSQQSHLHGYALLSALSLPGESVVMFMQRIILGGLVSCRVATWMLRRPSSFSIMAVLHRSVMLCGSLLYPGHIVLMFQRAISSGNFLVDLIML